MVFGWFRLLKQSNENNKADKNKQDLWFKCWLIQLLFANLSSCQLGRLPITANYAFCQLCFLPIRSSAGRGGGGAGVQHREPLLLVQSDSERTAVRRGRVRVLLPGHSGLGGPSY